MSFFLKGKSNNNKLNNKKTSRKRKAPSKSQAKNEDVTSSEDEEFNKNNDMEESDDDQETAQEKKLRLAKIYLQEIEKAEKEKLQDQELDDACKGDLIQRRLKEDYLKQAGRLKLSVAHEYSAADVKNIKVLTCKEHKQSVTVLCVSSDNTIMFTGSKDGNLVKWSLKTHTKIGSIPYIKKIKGETSQIGHSTPILSVALSSDSEFLAVGDHSCNIQIWSPSDLKHVKTLCGHRGGVTGLTFRKDTHTLYSASKDRSVKVWSLDEMTYIETMYGHLNEITAIDSLTRERVITSGGRDTTIRIWKVAEESQLIYNGHSGSIDCVKLMNEESFISGGDDGQLSIWGANKKKPLCSVENAHGFNENNQEPNWICSVATLVNTDFIASGSYDGIIRFWQLSDSFKKITKLFEVQIEGFINSMCFTNDGQYLIAAIGRDHKFGRWHTLRSIKNRVVVIPLLKIR